ncbi:HD-GYP domain-containing protein [Oceanithermus sp.]|uniref:HD-GYP domain-containing protein n=1 Tax=Oceanithermus sp. TaxID=2268145 RepID=UPI0025797226|nr:HD-GYP domain-containing protein [Oceanithermus sp.]
MSPTSPLPRALRLLIVAATAAAAAAILLAYGLRGALSQPAFGWADVLFWGAFALLAEQFAVSLSNSVRASMRIVPAMAFIILFPAWVAGILGAVFYLPPWPKIGRIAWYKELYNRAVAALTLTLSGLAYTWATAHTDLPFLTLVIPIAVGQALFHSMLINAAVSLAMNVPYWVHWRKTFAKLAPSFVVLAAYGAALVAVYDHPPELLGGWGGWATLFLALPTYYVHVHWRALRRVERGAQKIVQIILHAIEGKDPYTRRHSSRVAEIAADVAEELGMPPEVVDELEQAAALHDVGKIYIPEALLQKPGALTPAERLLVQAHPLKAREFLDPLKEHFAPYYPVMEQHHERWDGSGYPRGLRGEEIHPWARIVAVADAYEAMTAGRSYQPAQSPEEALGNIVEAAGTHFDPVVIGAFVRAWKKRGGWVTSPPAQPPVREAEPAGVRA